MGRKLYIVDDMGFDRQLRFIATQNPTAALMWPWFLMAFDDWGRSEATPGYLKSVLFPENPLFTEGTIRLARDAFQQVGLIVLYEVAGTEYMAVPQDKWYKLQTHIRAEKRIKDDSKCPSPGYQNVKISGAQEILLAPENRASPSPSPSPSPSVHCPPDDGPHNTEPASKVEYTSDFEQFWAIYPRKDAKKAAFSCWKSRLRERPPVGADVLIAAARNYAAARVGQDPQYTLMARTFLGDKKRYEDYRETRAAPVTPSAGTSGVRTDAGWLREIARYQQELDGKPS